MIQSEAATSKITATRFHESTINTTILKVASASCYESKFMMQSEGATSKITDTQFHENAIKMNDIE